MNTLTRRGWALRLVLAITLAVLPFTASIAQAQGTAQNRLTVPITGTVTDAAGTASALAGTFTLQRFQRVGDQVLAIGSLVGTLTDTATGAVRNIVTQVALPVADIDGSCEVLHLELGPLDLNLLGLQVHLDQVVLDITAVPGSGNLLGNLLCSIAGLLDGGNLNTLVGLLNELLNILG